MIIIALDLDETSVSKSKGALLRRHHCLMSLASGKYIIISRYGKNK